MIDLSIEELKEFEKSKFWAFLTQEWIAWREDIRTQLENPANIRDVDCRLKGNAETVRNALNMLKATISANEDEQERDLPKDEEPTEDEQ